MTDKPAVLFVCVHNAGRSQMAAGYLTELAHGAIEVRSAGSLPGDQINPAAVRAMAEEGIDIADQTPKILTTESVQASDVVITDPRAAAGGPGLLAGKKVVLCTVRGGAYGAGTPREGWDHSTSYLRRILGDVWGADLTVVEREFTLVGVNPALHAFKDEAASLHLGALASAREAGKALAVA